MAKKDNDSDIGKIFITTDGFFNNRPDIKKKRLVAVVEQREDDGAIAVVKIYSKKNKPGTSCIKRLVLKPKKHTSLNEDSIVGNNVLLGITFKKSDGLKDYKAIFPRSLTDANDQLTKRELRKLRKGVRGKKSTNKKKYSKKIEKWKKHFDQ